MDPGDESKKMKRDVFQVQASSPPLPGNALESSTDANANPVPNGGREAWMQVVGAFSLTQNTWGLVMAHGAFQAGYFVNSHLTTFPPTLTWMGTVQACLILLIGILSSKAVNLGYFYPVAGIGLFLQVFGLLMISLCTKYHHFLLAGGVCVGIGSGFLFAPGITIAASYFTTRRPLAIAISTSGAAVGGIIFPIASYWLIVAVGQPWAARIISFIVFITSGSTIYTLRPRVSSPIAGSVFPSMTVSGFRDPVYFTLVVSTTLGLIALFVPYFYVPMFMLSLGRRLEIASYLLSAMNAVNVIGGLLLTLFATAFGELNTTILATYVSGFVLLLSLIARNEIDLIIIIMFYSFTSGYLLVLAASAVATIGLGTSPLCSRIRTAVALGSVGALIGGPVAGDILYGQNGYLLIEDLRKWNFNWALLFPGMIFLISGTFMTATRILKRGIRWAKI